MEKDKRFDDDDVVERSSSTTPVQLALRHVESHVVLCGGNTKRLEESSKKFESVVGLQ